MYFSSAEKSISFSVLACEACVSPQDRYLLAIRRNSSALDNGTSPNKMYMTATCTLSMGSKIIFKDRPIRSEMILNARDGNFVNNEYQSMPIITRDLGVKIKDAPWLSTAE